MSHTLLCVLLKLQEAYDQYCVRVRHMYTDDFWRVFSSVYTERGVVIDRVLRACRDVYVTERHKRKRFEVSEYEIRKAALRTGGDFSSHIMHEIHIPLGHLNLPTDSPTSMKFRFVNPLWAWVTAANVMVSAGHEMHFEPKVMLHKKTRQRLYGAGVSFGDCLKFAYARTPRNGKPALFGISFDGGDSGVSTRSSYPICVSVLNLDGTDPRQCGLVAFLPKLDVPESFRAGKNEAYLVARDFVLQTCIGAIIDELENVSRDGFSAYIGDVLMTFHPFLVAVRVDTKERKSYFGLKSDRYRHDTHMTHAYDSHI